MDAYQRLRKKKENLRKIFNFFIFSKIFPFLPNDSLVITYMKPKVTDKHPCY